MLDAVDGYENGEEKFITILFSDICGFSSKCERFSARKIIKLLNSYFDLMVDILTEHGAIIDYLLELLEKQNLDSLAGATYLIRM